MIDLDKLADPNRLFKAVEKVPMSHNGLKFELVDSLEDGVSLIMPWALTFDFMYGGKTNVTNTVLNIIGNQISDDLCKLASEGDVDSEDPFLCVMDGLKKIGKKSGTIQVWFGEVDVNELDTETKFHIEVKAKLV